MPSFFERKIAQKRPKMMNSISRTVHCFGPFSSLPTRIAPLLLGDEKNGLTNRALA